MIDVSVLLGCCHDDDDGQYLSSQSENLFGAQSVRESDASISRRTCKREVALSGFARTLECAADALRNGAA